MPRLYELTEAYARILALAEEAEDGEWLEALAGLQGAIEDKAENTAKVISMLQGDAEVFTAEAKVFQAEADRLASQAKTRQRRSEELKDYLKGNMERVGLQKVKAGLFALGIQNNSKPTCKVVDVNVIPSVFWRHPEPEVDKPAITAHWQETGEQVPGAEVVLGRHLRIR